MPVNPDFKDLLHHLNAAKVKYLVVGAYAVIHHTEPRYTKDLDIWIATDPENAKKTYEVLKKFGAPLNDLTPDDLTKPDLFYQIGLEPNRIDIVMGVKGLNFKEAWENRVKSFYDDEKIYFLSVDDSIKSKEAAGRPHDKLDAESLRFAKEWKQKNAKK